MRSSPLLTSTVAALCAASIAVPTSANASNFSGASGWTGCVANMADNANHYFWGSGITPATAAAVSWTRTNN